METKNSVHQAIFWTLIIMLCASIAISIIVIIIEVITLVLTSGGITTISSRLQPFKRKKNVFE